MEKRKYEGLDVPVEPKLDWYWLSDTSAGCEIGKGGDFYTCAYTYCHKCIYSRYNAAKRNSFYKYFIDNTPAIGQKELLDKTWARLIIGTTDVLNEEPEKKQEANMDNVERKLAEAFREFTKATIKKYTEDYNMKKSETAKPKVCEYFRNLVIPVEPKRDWAWMKDNNGNCHGSNINCAGVLCRDCIYSFINHKARAAFYDLTFGESKKDQDFEVGDIVEYTAEHKTSLYTKEELTVTTPILAVRLEKETDSKLYLVYWYGADQTRYLDLSKYEVKLIKKAK